MSSRNSSSCFWPMTRVLPNQRRSGTMRVEGSSLLCRSCLMSFPFLSRTGFCLYIMSRRTVAADRMLCEPLPLPSVDMECPGFLVPPEAPPGDFAPPAGARVFFPMLKRESPSASRRDECGARGGCDENLPKPLVAAVRPPGLRRPEKKTTGQPLRRRRAFSSPSGATVRRRVATRARAAPTRTLRARETLVSRLFAPERPRQPRARSTRRRSLPPTPVVSEKASISARGGTRRCRRTTTTRTRA